MNLTCTVCSICIYFYHLAEAARGLYQQPRIVQKCHSSSWVRVWAEHPQCSCCPQGGDYGWYRVQNCAATPAIAPCGTEFKMWLLRAQWALSHHSSCCAGRFPAVFVSAGMCSSLGSLLWLCMTEQDGASTRQRSPRTAGAEFAKPRAAVRGPWPFISHYWVDPQYFQAQHTENVQLCSADPQPVQLSCISTADTFKLFHCSLKDFC